MPNVHTMNTCKKLSFHSQIEESENSIPNNTKTKHFGAKDNCYYN